MSNRLINSSIINGYGCMAQGWLGVGPQATGRANSQLDEPIHNKGLEGLRPSGQAMRLEGGQFTTRGSLWRGSGNHKRDSGTHNHCSGAHSRCAGVRKRHAGANKCCSTHGKAQALFWGQPLLYCTFNSNDLLCISGSMFFLL